VFLDPSTRNYYQHGQSLPVISAQNVADVTLRGLGLAPVSHDTSSSYFVKNDYFDRPRASISLLVDSLGDELVSKYGLGNFMQWRTSETSAPISFESYPHTSLALAASISSGVSPSEHGIVARSWSKKGQMVRAFTDSITSAQSPNIADIMSASFDSSTNGSPEGKSFTLSASSDSQMASAHCAHQLTGNNYCVTMNEANDFATVSSQQSRELRSAVTMTATKLKRAVTDPSGVLMSMSGRVQLESGAHGIMLTYPDGSDEQKVEYDLSKSEDYGLFAEIQYAISISSQLSSKPLASLVNDDAPDYFAFTFASLTPLMERYGRGSPEFVGALHLIDATLPKVMAEFSEAYGRRAVFQIVSLGSQDSHATSDMRVVTSQVDSVLYKQTTATPIRESFPYIYVAVQNAAQLAELCDHLAAVVDQSGFSVYCPAPDPLHYSDFIALSQRMFVMDASYSSTNSSDYSDNNIQRYQICLWFSIIMVFVLIAVVLATIYMPIQRDSMVYGQFNPTWEDRKRGK